MKTINKTLLLAASLLASLYGCQEDRYPGAEEKKDNALILSVVPPAGNAKLQDMEVYFVADGRICKTGSISVASSTGGQFTQAFTEVPATATEVIVLGNVATTRAADAPEITVGTPLAHLEQMLLLQSTQTGADPGATFYGRTGIVPTGESGPSLSVSIAPVASLLRIQKVEVPEDFKLTGIYINNVYSKMQLDGSPLPSDEFSLNYGSTHPIWIDGSYPKRFCDETCKSVAWNFCILPSNDGTIINGQQQSAMPHIVLHLERNTYRPDASLPSSVYATVRYIRINGKPLTHPARGRIYTIPLLTVIPSNLCTKPEVFGETTLIADATVSGWDGSSPTSGGGQPSVADNTANCYIVAPGTTDFSIPVARANADGVQRIGATDELTAELVWTDSPSPLTVASAIRSVGIQGTGNAATLHVQTGGADGNAVIAVKAGADIKWSWHIWVTNYTPTGHPGDFMDRNLGALANSRTTHGGIAALGLLYQWGRKDPFPASGSAVTAVEPPLWAAAETAFSIPKVAVSAGPNLEQSIAHPSTFYINADNSRDWYAPTGSGRNDALWEGADGRKTVYDPCPAGWKVPSMSDWNLLTASNFLAETSVPKGRTTTEHGGWYPAAGYRSYNTGELAHVGVEGIYWNASTFGVQARVLYFYNNFFLPGNTNHRAYGFPVRCVKE